MIFMDHQPLKWLLTLKSPTGRLARWSLLLQSYNLQFSYTPGKQNVIADTLSRPPCPNYECLEESECNHIEVDIPKKGSEDFRKAQLEDEEIHQIIKAFENGNENLTRYINRGYIMIDGILYRCCSEQDSENGQLVLPKSLREEILFKFLNDKTAGHYGIDKTISRITNLFYWPGIRGDIEKYVKSCEECKKYKPTNLKPMGLLQTVSSNQRFEIIAVDLFGPLPKSSDGHQWVLIVEDLCSRWIELFPLREASAENCAKILLNEVFLRYGIPRRIHTDNGVQFISGIMQNLTFCLGIQQSFNPIYHPESNPVERKNRDLKTQLSIYVRKEHTKWHLMLPSVRFAMNTAKCDSTGYSAAYLTFGREMMTPTEVKYDFKAIIKSENFVPQVTPYLMRLANTLELAREAQEQMQDKNKKMVDRTRRPQSQIGIGDKVLVDLHILSKANKGITAKFTPRRDGPYIIIAKRGASCYTVANPKDPETPIATHHVSALVPYEGTSSKPIYPMRKRGRPKNSNKQTSYIEADKSMGKNQKPQPSNKSAEEESTSQPRRSARLQNKRAKY